MSLCQLDLTNSLQLNFDRTVHITDLQALLQIIKYVWELRVLTYVTCKRQQISYPVCNVLCEYPQITSAPIIYCSRGNWAFSASLRCRKITLDVQGAKRVQPLTLNEILEERKIPAAVYLTVIVISLLSEICLYSCVISILSIKKGICNFGACFNL